ncbi:MAG: DUF4292 domain-containing protein [Thermonemataceae bacterium]
MLLLLFSACKKKRITRNIDPNIPDLVRADTIKEDIKIVETDFEYFSSKAKIYFSNGQEEDKAKINIRIKKDSIIWLNMHKAGIEGIRAMITKDSIFIINRVKKEYDTYNFKALSEQYNFNLNYDLLQSIIIGDMPIKHYQKRNVLKNAQFYVIRQTDGIVSIDNYISLKKLRLEKLRVTEVNSQNTLDLSYSDFALIQEMFFPKKNQASLSYKRESNLINVNVEIQHDNIELTDEPLRFPFRVPNSYQKNSKG